MPYQGLADHTIGEILRHIDDAHMEKAETWIKKVVESGEYYHTRWQLARDYALYSDFFKKKGDLAQAREKLKTAIDIFRGVGADGWVTKYEEELAKL